MATVVVANGLGSSAILMGAIGGAGGYFLEQTFSTASTSYYDNTGSIVGSVTNIVGGIVGTAASDVSDLIDGGWKWYIGAAGLGAASAMVAGETTGTMVFPLVLSVVSGVGLGIVNSIMNPPTVVNSVNQQDCANGNLSGCATKNPDGSLDTWGTIKNAISTNPGKFLSLPGMIDMLASTPWK